MKTIEDIYAEMFEEHENVMAARRQERIAAANPYGCNQYGHRKGHGGSSRDGSSKQSEPEKKGDNKPEEKKPQANEQPASVRKQLEQARQEAIALVRSGKAHTPEHNAALRKIKELEEALEKEKTQERINIRKQEREKEKDEETAKQNRVNEIKKMSPKERSDYAEELGAELQRLEIEQGTLNREIEKAEKEKRSTRDLMKRYREWRMKYEEWKKRSNELEEAIGWK